jgi:hypothetical protein
MPLYKDREESQHTLLQYMSQQLIRRNINLYRTQGILAYVKYLFDNTSVNLI